MSVNIAFLSQGKLHLKRGVGAVRMIESKFGKDVRDRAVQIQQRHAWKSQGTSARFQAGGLLWGQSEHDPASMRIAIAGIARGCEPDELLYALQTEEVAGVFRVRSDSGEEVRLFHSTDYAVRHLSAHPNGEEIACVLGTQAGSNIAIMRSDGSEFYDVTEGDSVDLAPSWAPGASREIVFQSAGIARDEDGFPHGQGPFAVHRLDLESGEMTVVAEDPKHDLLGPRVGTDGGLYYIRRPYKAPGERPHVLRSFLDFLLLPFRLLYAVFQFLNFFTVRYTGKPLTTSGGAKQKEMDIRQMMVWGNMIDAEKAARAGRKAGEDAPALVPSSWQLVRDRGGENEVLAKGVLSFDLADDGSVVYSNGSAVYRLEGSGRPERVHVGQFIEQVIALSDS
jgi:hypothetical protein